MHKATRSQVLSKIQEVEDFMGDEFPDYITMLLYSDGSGNIGYDPYGEERVELFSFNNLDDFLEEANKFMKDRKVIWNKIVDQPEHGKFIIVEDMEEE